MKTAWLSLLACSLVGALAISACTVKDCSKEDCEDDSSGGAADTGGKTGSGGKPATGGTTGSGGKPATGGASSGGASSGGASSTGGDGGAAGGDDGPMCDASLGTPADSCNLDTSSLPAAQAKCVNCLKSKPACCTAMAACYATNPNNECGYGGPPNNPGETEYLCYQSCVLDAAAMNGGILEDAAEEACVNGCTRCSLISNETNDIIACMKDECAADCMP